MLVLLHVERIVVVPSEGHGELKTLQAVLISASVGAVSHCRVSVWNKFIVVRTESLPCFFCALLQDNNHEGSHEEGSITLLVVVEASVVVNLIILVLLIVHELLKLLAEEMNFSKVKWTEIGEVWFVNQIVVDAEVEGVLA